MPDRPRLTSYRYGRRVITVADGQRIHMIGRELPQDSVPRNLAPLPNHLRRLVRARIS